MKETPHLSLSLSPLKTQLVVLFLEDFVSLNAPLANKWEEFDVFWVLF